MEAEGVGARVGVGARAGVGAHAGLVAAGGCRVGVGRLSHGGKSATQIKRAR